MVQVTDLHNSYTLINGTVSLSLSLSTDTQNVPHSMSINDRIPYSTLLYSTLLSLSTDTQIVPHSMFINHRIPYSLLLSSLSLSPHTTDPQDVPPQYVYIPQDVLHNHLIESNLLFSQCLHNL